MSRDIVTAVHEAGHAVAYLDQGIPFRYVTLNPRGDDEDGKVVVRPRSRDARSLAVITAAGPAAEAVFDALNSGEDFDLDEAFEIADMVLGMGGCCPEELATARAPYQDVEDTTTRALDLLHERWSDVKRVAGALLQSSRALPYNAVVSLVGADR